MLLYLIQETKNSKFEGMMSIVLSEKIKEKTNASCYLLGPTSYSFLNLTPHQFACSIMVDDESSNLPKDKLKDEINKIGGCKLRIYNKSFNELGLDLELVDDKTNKELATKELDFFAENNIYPLYESVAHPNLSTSDKISLMVSQLTKINCNKKALTIVDPYFFPNNFDTDYVNVFSNIIVQCGCSDLKVITYKNRTNRSIRVQMECSLSIPMVVHDADTYSIHDRYWINEIDKKGLNVGTSLNGIGKTLSTITELDSADTTDVINFISSIYNPF